MLLTSYLSALADAIICVHIKCGKMLVYVFDYFHFKFLVVSDWQMQ